MEKTNNSKHLDIVKNVYSYGKEQGAYIGTFFGLFSGMLIGYSLNKINIEWLKNKFNRQ